LAAGGRGKRSRAEPVSAEARPQRSTSCTARVTSSNRARSLSLGLQPRGTRGPLNFPSWLTGRVIVTVGWTIQPNDTTTSRTAMGRPRCIDASRLVPGRFPMRKRTPSDAKPVQRRHLLHTNHDSEERESLFSRMGNSGFLRNGDVLRRIRRQLHPNDTTRIGKLDQSRLKCFRRRSRCKRNRPWPTPPRPLSSCAWRAG
jgi:hypothetical protein